MLEFGKLAQALVETVNHPNLLIPLFVLYTPYLFAGIVIGKIACKINDRLAVGAAIAAVLFIMQVYEQGGGKMIFPIVWPPAWVGWGVLIPSFKVFYSQSYKTKSGV